MATAENGKVVLIHFKLTDAKNGEVIEDSTDRDPMPYLHGANNIIRGLENAMDGKTAGDKFQVTVEPSEAYGEKNEANIQRISAKHFKKCEKIAAGAVIELANQTGAGSGDGDQGRPL